MQSFYTALKEKFRERDFVWILISVCVAVFLLTSTLSLIGVLFQQESIVRFSNLYLCMPLSFAKLLHTPWTVFTNIFVHIGIGHLFFNMLTLFWFGQIYQLYLNNKYAWKVFFGGAIFGCVLVLFAYNFIPYFSQTAETSLLAGASGGILAIIFAAVALNPEYEVSLLFFGRIRLKYIALIMILLNYVSLLGTNSGGVIAHLGGAAFGFLYMKQIQHGRDLLSFSFRKKMRVVHSNPQPFLPEQKSENEGQKRLDKILDKISRSGYDSLSKAEKDFLFKFSKKED